MAELFGVAGGQQWRKYTGGASGMISTLKQGLTKSGMGPGKILTRRAYWLA
ncbi:MAG: hypothetical protein IOC39_00845 [Burkholderia sp.]|jgi:hypothetical protein|uniref:hypothetical protein n=1 Tax=Burkholderia sp. TaxID=36773 RepID=UPI00258415EA|nr:hypothetical protein [Burkholderia sp.]MCA3781396.1 hypothetical protein [Burkholderia sp.]MCA3795488.1 hypothetical protein [Burkholderia sp.]MCA3805521.1 hypothetical protein [Burkholderia sp.]MCA3809049.1 hypothetical protein [Burkholderia sp.]MCA3814339.1 hypothetical protein [Burkholderia sp.]